VISPSKITSPSCSRLWIHITSIISSWTSAKALPLGA
jgi:hypothetical protein